MSVSGSIQDFSIVDVLQYINASRKSGRLIVERDGEEVRIFFQGGQIIRASHPVMRNLGRILVESFDVTQEALQNAVRIQKSQGSPKPIGKILVETNTVSHSTLREAMFRQIEETMIHLVSWETGFFRFEVSEPKSPDDILAKPDDLLLPEEANTQLILLDAVRQFDEDRSQTENNVFPLHRDQPSEKEKDEDAIVGAENQDLHDPLDEDIGLSLPLLKMMLSEVGQNMRGREITLQFLNVLSEHVQRAILFVKRQGELVGIGGFGSMKDGQSLRENANVLKLPLTPDQLPYRQIEARGVFYDVPPSEPWVKQLYENLEAPKNPNTLLFSVAGTDQFICLVYADNEQYRHSIKNLDLIEVAGGQTALIIENKFLRKRLERFQKRGPGK